MLKAEETNEDVGPAVVKVPVPLRPLSSTAHEKTWVKTMESSLTPSHLMQPNPDSMALAREWTGWIVAIVCLFALAVTRMKSRRQSRFLRNAGQRDFSIVPPSGERRRRRR